MPGFLDFLRQAIGGVTNAAEGYGSFVQQGQQNPNPLIATGAGLAGIPIQALQLPPALLSQYIERFRAPGIQNRQHEAQLDRELNLQTQDPGGRERARYNAPYARRLGTTPIPTVTPGAQDRYDPAAPGQPYRLESLPPMVETKESLDRDYTRQQIETSKAQAGLAGARTRKLGQAETDNETPPDGLSLDQSVWFNESIQVDDDGKRKWIWKRKVKAAGGTGTTGAGAPGGGVSGVSLPGGTGGAFNFAGDPNLAKLSPAAQQLASSAMWDEQGTRSRIHPNILRAVGWQESHFNPQAVGVMTRYGKARGMGQFIPETGRRYGIDDSNWHDPAVQIKGIGEYLQKELLPRTNGDIMRALELYHGVGADPLGMTGKRYAQEVMQKAQILSRLQQQGAPTQQLPAGEAGSAALPAGAPAPPAPGAPAPMTTTVQPGQPPGGPAAQPAAPQQPGAAPGAMPPGTPAGPDAMPSFEEINAGAAAGGGGGGLGAPSSLPATAAQQLGQQPTPQPAPGQPAPAPQRTQADLDIFGPDPAETTATPTAATPQPFPPTSGAVPSEPFAPTSSQMTPVRSLQRSQAPPRLLGQGAAAPGSADGAQVASPDGALLGSPGGAQLGSPGGAMLGSPAGAMLPGSPEGAQLQGSASGAFVAGGGAPSTGSVSPVTQAPPPVAPGPPGAPTPTPTGATPGAVPGAPAGATPRPGLGLIGTGPTPLAPGYTGVPGTVPVASTRVLFPDPTPTYVQLPNGGFQLQPVAPWTPDEIKMVDTAAHVPGMDNYIATTYTFGPGGKFPDATSARRNAVMDPQVRRAMDAWDLKLKAGATTSANKVAQIARAQIAKDFLSTYTTQVRRMTDLQPDTNRDGTPRIALDALSSDPAWIDLSGFPVVGDIIGQGGYGIPLYLQDYFQMDPSWQSIRQKAIKGDGASIIMRANLGSVQNAVRALGDVGNLAVAEQENVARNLLPSPGDSREQALGKVLHFNQMLTTIQMRLESGQTGEQALRDVFRSGGLGGDIAPTRQAAEQAFGSRPPSAPVPFDEEGMKRALTAPYNPRPEFHPYDATGPR